MQPGSGVGDAIANAEPKSPETNRYFSEKEIADIAKAAAEAVTKTISEIVEKRLAAMEDRIVKCEQNFTSLQHTSSTEISALRKEVGALKKDISRRAANQATVDRDINDLEQYSRRSHLRIRGLQFKQGEDHKQCVARFFTKDLQVPVCVEDLDAAHPLPSPPSNKTKSNNNNSSRTPQPKQPQMIVRFHARDLRDRVIKARRHLKGKKIVISDDLTAKNQRLLSQLRENDNITNCWSWEGKIFALHHGEQKPRRYKYGAQLPTTRRQNDTQPKQHH